MFRGIFYFFGITGLQEKHKTGGGARNGVALVFLLKV